MNDRARIYAAVAGTVLLFVLVQLGALALVDPFVQNDYQATADASSLGNIAVFFGAILVATAAMLLIIKFDVEWLIRGFIVATSAMLAWYVVSAVAPVGVVTAGGQSVALVPILTAAGIAVGLLVHPEWYVIDAAGVLMGAGAAGMFGISFEPLPAILFLVVLAVYDAVSVYGTEHMLTLADGVMDLNVPVLLVVPTSLSYSFRNPDAGQEMTDDADERLASDPDSPASRQDAEAQSASSPRSASPREDAAEQSSASPDSTPPRQDAVGTSSDEPSPASAREDAAEHSSASPDPASPRQDADAAASEAPDGGETPESSREASVPDDDGIRDALFIGLGDAVMPTILVASAAAFIPVEAARQFSVPVIALNLPALSAMIGTLLGLIVLLWMVLKGRPHAGLPLLNGGTILGYLIGALASGITLAQAVGLASF